MKVIEHIEVTNAAGETSVLLDSIPQDYDDLLVLCSLRTTINGGGWHDILVLPNASTADGTSRILYGNGSSATSFSESRINLRVSDASNTANTFGNGSIYIPNYASSNAKSVSMDGVTENNATAAHPAITASLWNNASAITSLQFQSTDPSGKIVQYSSFTLYGITSGSDGTTTVS